MPSCGYEFFLLVFNSISHYISSQTLKDKIHIHAQAFYILYILLHWDFDNNNLLFHLFFFLLKIMIERKAWGEISSVS